MFCILFASLLEVTIVNAYEPSLCLHDWNIDSAGNYDPDLKCPYGERVEGSVTVPKNSDWKDVLSVAYGIVPHIVIALSVIECVVKAVRYRGIGTREFSFLCFNIFLVATNEIVFKNIWKEPRPEHSCSISCGMPSGHSAMSTGYFMLMFLDAACRVMPKVPMSTESAKGTLVASESHESGSFNQGAHEWKNAASRLPSMIPMSSADTMDTFEYIVFIVFWGCVLLPVPLSRVIVRDHTAYQAAVGCFMGLIQASVWFCLVRRRFMHPCNHLLGKRICSIFYHNYQLPRFEVISRCYLCLARGDALQAKVREGGSLSAPEKIDLAQKYNNVLEELIFYREQAKEFRDVAKGRGRHQDEVFFFQQRTLLRQLSVRIIEKACDIDVDLEPELRMCPTETSSSPSQLARFNSVELHERPSSGMTSALATSA